MEKFFNYFDSRYRENLIKGKSKQCGPIITISRQAGCDAVAVANKLVQCLNKKYNTDKWRCIDKEILLRAARELDTGTPRVENFIKGRALSGFTEMIMSISGDFISDMKVMKTIRDIVLSICHEGYVVLVGRGGVAITSGVKKALHVRLVAPFYWRVENLMAKEKLDIESAEEFVVDTDEKRYNLILTFLDKKPVNLEFLFDVTVNRRSFTVEQLARTLCVLYEKRIETVMKELSSRKGDLMSTYG